MCLLSPLIGQDLLAGHCEISTDSSSRSSIAEVDWIAAGWPRRLAILEKLAEEAKHCLAAACRSSVSQLAAWKNDSCASIALIRSLCVDCHWRCAPLLRIGSLRHLTSHADSAVDVHWGALRPREKPQSLSCLEYARCPHLVGPAGIRRQVSQLSRQSEPKASISSQTCCFPTQYQRRYLWQRLDPLSLCHFHSQLVRYFCLAFAVVSLRLRKGREPPGLTSTL